MTVREMLRDIFHPKEAVEREWASVPVARAIRFGEDPTLAKTLKYDDMLEGRQIYVPDFDKTIDNLVHDGDATGVIGGVAYKISVGTLPCLYYDDASAPMKCDRISTILVVNEDIGETVFEKDVFPAELDTELRRILKPMPAVTKPAEVAVAKADTEPKETKEAKEAKEVKEGKKAKNQELPDQIAIPFPEGEEEKHLPKSESSSEAAAQDLAETAAQVEPEKQPEEMPQPVVRVTLLDANKRGVGRRSLALKKKRAEEEERKKKEAEKKLEEKSEPPRDMTEEVEVDNAQH